MLRAGAKPRRIAKARRTTMPRSVNAMFDDHDYDQLHLLARLDSITRAELVRRL